MELIRLKLVSEKLIFLCVMNEWQCIYVFVGVTMYVLSISSISEVLMDFTLDFYFRQMWKDPRLKFEGTEGISTLSVGSEFL